jgi:hypothetical protein
VNEADAYERSRELTVELRDELRDLRRDVEAMVDAEVRKAADPARIDAQVREAVRRELRQRTPWLMANASWVGPVIGVAAGVAIGLSVLALVLAVRAGGEPEVVVAANPANAAAPGPVTAAANGNGNASESVREPARLAARYDSLLAARDARFEPHVRAIEAGTSSEAVREAARGWRAGTTSAAYRDRLHSALVQLALREIDPSLALDGEIQRDPCSGVTCRKLLDVWRSSGESWGLPAYTAGAAADGASVRTLERLLVLAMVEAR